MPRRDPGERWELRVTRRTVASVAFGLAAALVVATIGPVYATPLLIVALPVVFLTVSRVATGATTQPDFEWLLFAFGVSWLIALPFAPTVRNGPAAMPYWLALGLAPVLVAVVLLIRRRSTDPA